MPIEALNPISASQSADRTARILNQNALRLQQATARAASGLRITSPSVDAAGLAQLMAFEAQISRLDAVDVNLSNAVSFTQVQDGAMQQAQTALNRMGELSILAQDPTKSASDLAAYQQEFTQLQDFVGDLGGQTFNDVPLFSSDDLAVTSGANGETVNLSAIDLAADTSDGGIGAALGPISISNAASASAALDTITAATSNLANLRATAGGNLSALQGWQQSGAMLQENLSAAASRIGDADLASTSVDLAITQTLVQSGISTLATANQRP